MLDKFVSGFGQYHTNEYDPNNPNKTLTKYLAIGLVDVRLLVDSPPSTDKTHSQWLIPSSHPHPRRNFKEQEQHGSYSLLWADLDKNPPSIDELAGC